MPGVQEFTSLVDLPRSHRYHYEEPFLVVTSRLRDIGLVGWNERRWTHQDKAPAKRNRKARPRQAKAQWKQAFDPDSMQYYFYNEAAGQTTWEEPASGFVPDDTVQYYVDAGIAPMYTPPSPRTLSGPAAPTEQRAQTSAHADSSPSSHAALHQDASPSSRSHAQAAQPSTPPRRTASSVDPNTTAAQRFSPAKKGDLPGDVERYWLARYSLMSRWAEGVRLDERSLFSVTPEMIAKHQASMLGRCGIVLDAFCGSGGNAIQLALLGNKVLAFDIDGDQLAMARHNAAVYEVGDRIEFVLGDAFELAPAHAVDAVFLSPPWGGPQGKGCIDVFDPMQPIPQLGRSVHQCIELASQCLRTHPSAQDAPAHSTEPKAVADASLAKPDAPCGADGHEPNVAVFLPRNTCLNGLAASLQGLPAPIDPVCLERNILNDQLKSVTLYLHALKQ